MQERSDRLAKIVFVLCGLLLFFTFSFLLGAYAYRADIPPVPQIKSAVKAWRGEGDLFTHPRTHHLQPSRGQGDGVVTGERLGDGALVMLTGFFDEENQIRLLRRDGSVVRKWSLDYFEHFPEDARLCDLATNLNVDIHGALLTPNGDAVLNYEYCGTVKLDQCSRQVWRVDERTHHSLIPAEGGGYWALGRWHWQAADEPERLYPFAYPALDVTMLEDTILRLSEEGEVLEEVSIPELMFDQGLGGLLTATQMTFGRSRIPRTEVVHANKAAELTSALADAFPLFEAGDLAVSIREMNLIFVVDPDTWEVKWHQTGPWLRQHDPEFRPDGRFSIFNNNAFRTSYPREQIDLSAPRTTNIIAVDPVSRETEVIFGEREGQEMLSVVRGQHELLGDGGMVIAEFDAGRVLEVDAAGNIVWEYVNAYDEDFVGEITNADVYPAGYFTTDWAPCE